MTTCVDDEKLLDVLELSRESGDPKYDVVAVAPDLTVEDAYRLQIGLKKRLAAKGDRHVGYRVSFTSRAGMAFAADLGLISREASLGPITPMFSSLSASNLAGEDRIVRRLPNRDLVTEAEVVFIMDKPLAGPGVTAAMAHSAVAAVYPGFDVAQSEKGLIEKLRNSKERKMTGITGFVSLHGLASMCTPEDTTIVLGTQPSSPLLDLRTEGLVISVDGRPRVSGCSFETLGGPLNSIVWLANELAKYGARLEPGQIVITGTPVFPPSLEPGIRIVTAEFTRLGSVTVVVEN